MRKPVFGVSDTNRAVQSQKMARLEILYLGSRGIVLAICSENKGADQLRGYRELICVFISAYAKSRFSLDEAHLIEAMPGFSI